MAESSSRLIFELTLFVLGTIAIFVGAVEQEFLSFLIGSVAVVVVTVIRAKHF